MVITSCKTIPVSESGIRDGTLYKYVKLADGTYRYDFNIPVQYNRFSNEPVNISGEFVPNKYQFRASWVATIFSMNMPNTTSAVEFKKEYTKILNTHTDWNMNALIFQVSPLLDSFYPSKINPWSQYVTGTWDGANITGKQGVDPGWDPLEWMLAETHKRGLEYHAWFNPYRVTASKHRFFTVPGKTKEDLDAMDTGTLIRALNAAGILADTNFAVLHPEYVYRFDEKLYLDAGFPEVRQHVVDTIKEVIEKYDVDAIHFDDYFYPYPSGGSLFGAAKEDRIAFEKYGLGKYPDTPEGIDSWRRDNNTALIKAVKSAISAENLAKNRAIQFGVSPFGIWEHKENNPLGSNTPAGSSRTYSNAIFADTYKWVKEALLDYICPQIYWSFDQGAAPYGELTRWWANVVEGTPVHLYTGHSNYKHVNNGSSEAAWMNPEEIVHQLKFNQQFPQVKGSSFFSYTDLLPSSEAELKHKVANNESKLLKAHYQSFKTIVPPKPWLKKSAPLPVLNLVRQRDNEITWNDAVDNDSRYYVVYRVLSSIDTGDMNKIIGDPFNIAARVWRNGQTHTFKDNVKKTGQYTYIVTAVNAAHIESAPTIVSKRQTN
jgi:uncharacterized lipoprotein YddW (UPF0748 family)